MTNAQPIRPIELRGKRLYVDWYGKAELDGKRLASAILDAVYEQWVDTSKPISVSLDDVKIVIHPGADAP